MKKLEDLDALILCGGLGRRLRAIVADRPKSMACISNKPFLDILVGRLSAQGIRRVILCIGYKGEVIKNYFGAKKSKLEIAYSQETEPLGTGGALKKAGHLIKSRGFFAMNGDTIGDVDLEKFYSFHKEKKSLLSIVLTRADNREDCGFVSINNSFRITAFNEKSNKLRFGLVSSGIYFMQKSIFKLMPKEESFSLEQDFFPCIIGNSRCFGFVTDSGFIDIGTPQRYRHAQRVLRKH